MNADQRSKLEELDRKFYAETRNLRDEIWTKSADTNVAYNSTN
jgi:hypothetical protein